SSNFIRSGTPAVGIMRVPVRSDQGDVVWPMLKPALAPVRPHVISPVTGDSVPLEDEGRGYLERRQTGLIVLLGEADSGKTTALAHLAARLPADDLVRLVDNYAQETSPEVPRGGLTICARRQPPPWRVLATLRLQLWGRDEWIE